MLTRMLHYSMNVRGMMSISSYVHMIIVVEIEGEDEHSKVLVFLNVHRKCYLQGGIFALCLQIVLIPTLIILYFFCTPCQLVKLHLSVTKEC